MKRICMILCFLLLTPMLALTARADTIDGDIRVYLRSLGEVSQLSMTTQGEYSVNENAGLRLQSGARLTVRVHEDSLYLVCGALIMDMGESFTLTRHGETGGLYIDGSARGLLYMGDLEMTLQKGTVLPILTIHLEDYLLGVVPYEMSDSFPLEALKAQAVAARTYALRRRESRDSRGYDVMDTTADQVFMGYDPSAVNALEACRATEGMTCMFDGQYGNCYYTASNGGQTLLPADVWKERTNDGYTVRRDDPYDVSNSRSKVKSAQIMADGTGLTEEMQALLLAAAAEQLASLGYSDDPQDVRLEKITSMEPVNPAVKGSRWYTDLRITFTMQGKPLIDAGEIQGPPTLEALEEESVEAYVTGPFETVETECTVDIPLFDTVKSGLALEINGGDYELFTVVPQVNEEGQTESYTIEARRFGHGAGMSQRGAQEMAGVYGMSCEEILAFYYPAMKVETHTVEKNYRQALPPLAEVAEGTLPPLEAGERYGTVRVAGVSAALNVRSQPTTQSDILTQAYEGQKLIITGEAAEGWYAVRTAQLTGFVSAEYIELD